MTAGSDRGIPRDDWVACNIALVRDFLGRWIALEHFDNQILQLLVSRFVGVFEFHHGDVITLLNAKGSYYILKY